jgi:acyl carrier protein
MIQKQQIYEAVVKAVTEILELNGKPIPIISEQTRPIGDLAGFDSLNALETIILISTSLGVDIAPEITLFAGDGHPRTISGIVDCIHHCINS